jgi:hypothetical protein
MLLYQLNVLYNSSVKYQDLHPEWRSAQDEKKTFMAPAGQDMISFAEFFNF